MRPESTGAVDGRVLEVGVTDAGARDRALERLAGAAARRGFRIARDLLRDPAEAEDLVQEALARACREYGALRDPAALEGWFHRVLVNLCMRTLRRRRLGRAIRALWGGGEAAPGPRGDEAGAPPPREPADASPPADEAVAQAASVARLFDGVDALPPMQRAAVVLRYGHDLGVGEIAAALGIGPGTVKTHLVRGLDRLRGALARAGEGRGST
jgi:RNA polymerase sigma-70 factor, ECF subfamily